jgi:capsular polysaccharide export protein
MAAGAARSCQDRPWVLIDYPRYFDPVSGLPCPVEVAVDRLAAGCLPETGPGLRALAGLQEIAAGLGTRS